MGKFKKFLFNNIPRWFQYSLRITYSGPWHSCDPRNNSINIAWKLVSNAEHRLYPRPTEPESSFAQTPGSL